MNSADDNGVMRLPLLVSFACAAAFSSAAQAPILWSATPTYATGTIVQGSSGNLFRAIHPSVNHNPELDGHLYWEMYQIRTSTILHVGGTNTQFKLLSSA